MLWPSPSLLRPPVNNIAENKIYQVILEEKVFVLNIKCATWLIWNLVIAVAVHGSFGNELDPVLDLGHPGIHTVTGTLAAIADHTNLGESSVICNV